jgi:sarcosine oxidase subunit gamma
MTAAVDVEIRTIDLGAQLSLRFDPSDREVLERIRSGVGVEPPTEPTTVARTPDGERHILWLGPDEWLVVAEQATAVELEAGIRDGARDAFVSTVDVSANRVAIEIRGRDARDLLAFGCPLDLESPAFGPGRCAGTLVARAGVILWQLDDAPTFRLLVRPSFAGYLQACLDDAAEGLA